jgi:hypothetical protein
MITQDDIDAMRHSPLEDCSTRALVEELERRGLVRIAEYTQEVDRLRLAAKPDLEPAIIAATCNRLADVAVDLDFAVRVERGITEHGVLAYRLRAAVLSKALFDVMLEGVDQ